MLLFGVVVYSRLTMLRRVFTCGCCRSEPKHPTNNVPATRAPTSTPMNPIGPSYRPSSHDFQSVPRQQVAQQGFRTSLPAEPSIPSSPPGKSLAIELWSELGKVKRLTKANFEKWHN